MGAKPFHVTRVSYLGQVGQNFKRTGFRPGDIQLGDVAQVEQKGLQTVPGSGSSAVGATVWQHWHATDIGKLDLDPYH